MPVIYDGQSIRPAPQVTLSQSYEASGDGRIVGVTTTARLEGTIVADVLDGVDTPHDTLAKLGVIIAKQQEMRSVFSTNGKLLEVQGWDGSTPAKLNAIVDSIEFSPGPWVNGCEYVIVLHGPQLADGAGTADTHCTSISETWQFEEAEVAYTWKATHSVSARGKLVYDATGAVPTPPWQIAKSFVLSKLGLGWDTRTAPEWSPLAGVDLADVSEAAPQSLNAWNRSVAETVDEADGTYSATETWLLAAVGYVEQYTASARKVEDQAVLTAVVDVSGTIRGSFVAQGDYATRYANAVAGWGTVRDLLSGRAAAAAGVSLNSRPSAADVTHDAVSGTITYQYQYNNRVLTSDTWETYTVAQKRGVEDLRTTVTVAGSVHGVLYPDDDTDPSVRFARAASRWPAVRGLAYARAVSATGLTDLKSAPKDATVEEDVAEGVISYSYDFDNRPSPLAVEEFTVSRRHSREDGRSTVAIEGTIRGFPSGDIFAPGEALDARLDNAMAYWNSREPTLLGVAATYTRTDDVFATPWTTSVSQNPMNGSVAYAYEFMTGVVCFPNALSESITITDDDSVPVFAEIPVPGRGVGPIIQDMATVTAKRRMVVVELIFPPATSCGYVPPPQVDVSQFAPAGSVVKKTQDQTVWDYLHGHLSRTLGWTYI